MYNSINTLIFLFTYTLVTHFFTSNISLVRRSAAKVYEIPQPAFQHDQKSTESTCTVKMMILATKTLISCHIFLLINWLVQTCSKSLNEQILAEKFLYICELQEPIGKWAFVIQSHTMIT